VLSASGGSPLAWSSDGTELLIARGDGLVVLRSDGSEVALASHGSSGMAGGSFTPDGKEVVYGVNLSIYEADAGGGTPRLIVTGDEAAGTGYVLPFTAGGQLSPDGATIAYVRVVDFHFRGLWLMNLDGTGQRELASSSTIADLYGGADFQDIVPAAWSPDGSRLAFNGDGKTHCVLFVINADGTGLQRVTPQHACNLSPSWSPDGSRIAVTDEHSLLRMMNPDGTDVREFPIDTGGQPLFAVWNPVR
jgi:Tol biopolymer transport system component